MNLIKWLNRKSRPVIPFLLIVLLHYGVISLFYFDIIPQAAHHDPLIFHHGGDQLEYFDLARSLSELRVTPSRYPLGFSLFLVPFILTTNPETARSLIPSVSLFQGLILIPLTYIIFSATIKKGFKNRYLWLITTLTLVVLPLIMWLGLALVGIPLEGGDIAVRLTGFQMLSDPLALTLTYGIIFLFGLASKKNHTSSPYIWITIGLLCGALTITRLSGLLLPVVILLLLILQGNHKQAVTVALLSVCFTIPQFIYNYHFFGSPLRTGYNIFARNASQGFFSFINLTNGIRALASSRWLPISLFSLAVILFALIIGSYSLLRLNRKLGLLIVLFTLLHIGFHAIFRYTWSVGGLLRFMMPVYPSILLMIMSGTFFVFKSIRRKLSLPC
jgi:hypothetical protein